MHPATQTYTRYLRGHPYDYRNGGQGLVNISQTPRSLTTSWPGIMPQSASPQYNLPPNDLELRTILTTVGDDSDIPRKNSLVSALSSSLTGSAVHTLLPNISQDYPQESTSLSHVPDYIENHVPISMLDAPHGSSSSLHEILKAHLQDYPSAPQPLGYVRNQVPMLLPYVPPGSMSSLPTMPQECSEVYSTQFLGSLESQTFVSPLDAPQESSCLPNHRELQNERLMSVGTSGPRLQNQENGVSGSLPLSPESMRVAKRKREVSPIQSDETRQNPAVSAYAHATANRTSRARKTADFNPVNCPFCSKLITRPRRLPGHVKICRALKELILTHQFSETETVDAIKKWGIPKFMLEKIFGAHHFQNSTKDRKDREDLVRQLSDEGVVKKLIEWGVPESMFKNTGVSMGVHEGSTSQARPSHPHSNETLYDHRTAVEDPAPSASQASASLWDTYGTRSESSLSSEYTEGSAITNFPATHPPYAEKEALWQRNIQHWSRPTDQANEFDW